MRAYRRLKAEPSLCRFDVRVLFRGFFELFFGRSLLVGAFPMAFSTLEV